MFSLITLVQSLGLAYAAGLNLYATVAITGLAVRYGWVHNVPTTIEGFGNLAVILIAVTLYSIEFLATLIPGVASAWETLHSLIRPPAAAANIAAAGGRIRLCNVSHADATPGLRVATNSML